MSTLNATEQALVYEAMDELHRSAVLMVIAYVILWMAATAWTMYGDAGAWAVWATCAFVAAVTYNVRRRSGRA